jgi:hypothetical protein
MKKIKLFALAAFAMLSINAFADDTTDDTWQYEVTNSTKKEAKLKGFVDAKKGTVENLVIPAEVTGEGGVKYTITAIGEDAFKNDAKIKTVTFTAAITEIGVNAFNNVYNLTTLTFPEGSKLARIGNYAFAKCDALTKIDLSKTQVVDLRGYTPFVPEEDPGQNIALEEIVLSANTTYIGTALANLKVLAKTNISATRILSIEEKAFANDAKLTSLELPEVHLYNEITGQLEPDALPTTLAANALKDSYIATLTINGAVLENGIDALGATKLTEVNFKGKLSTGAIKAGAFVGNKKLAKVTIAEAEEEAVAGGSFTDCATTEDGAKTLTFTITKAEAVVFNGQTAFADAPVVEEAKCNVTIVAPNDAVGDVPYRAKFTPKADDLPQIKVYGTSTFYGKFINKTGENVAIKRADATVYSVYVDGAKVYMDPLQVVDGAQVIEDGEVVIIKTTSPKSGEDYKYVEYTKTPDDATMRYASGSTTPINDLEGLTKTGDEFDYASTIKGYEPTKVLYVVGDLSKGLQWLTPKDAVRLYDNTVYIFADAEAAGRLTTIWLDGSEPTAIQKIETKSENNDAIYNLQGVRVNKAGKGIYIQNGKKFIVK